MRGRRLAAVEAMELAPPSPVAPAAGGAVRVRSSDDALHADGPGYGARFDAEGLRISASSLSIDDRASSLGFRLSRVGREGGPPLAVDASRPQEDVIADTIAYVHQGGQLVERYQLRANGVEQSFLFQEIPAGDGDLVIAGSLDTWLHAEDGEYGDEGILFRGDGEARIHVGGVLAIDGRGRRSPGLLRLEGGELQLRVPGEFLDGAVAPLLVDPLISPVVDVTSLVSLDIDTTEPDIAFDSVSGRYLAVWRHTEVIIPWIPAVLHQVLGRFYDRDGVALGPPFAIESGGSFPASVEWTEPAVCYVRESQRFLVVYRTAQSLRCRSVVPSSGAVSADAALETTSPANPIESLDCGGDPVLGFDEALVAWTENGREVAARMVQVPALGPPVASGAKMELDFDGTLGISDVSVTNTNGPPGLWMVTWQRFFDDAFGTDHDARGQLVEFTGVPCGGLVTLFGEFDIDEAQVVAATSGNEIVVLCERTDAVGTTIVSKSIDLPVGCTAPSVPAESCTLDSGPGGGYLPRTPALDWAGSHYLATWHRDPVAVGVAHSIMAVRLDEAGCASCGLPYELRSSSSDLAEPRIYAEASADGSSSDRAMAVWQWATPGSGTQLIQGAVLEAVGTGGPVVNLGGGCGAAGTISLSGPAILGNEDFSAELTGAPPDAVAAVLLITYPDDPEVSSGGCTYAIPSAPFDQYLQSSPLGPGGSASRDLSLGCSPALDGFTVCFQWLVVSFDVSTGKITTAFTDRICVTISQ